MLAPEVRGPLRDALDALEPAPRPRPQVVDEDLADERRDGLSLTLGPRAERLMLPIV